MCKGVNTLGGIPPQPPMIAFPQYAPGPFFPFFPGPPMGAMPPFTPMVPMSAEAQADLRKQCLMAQQEQLLQLKNQIEMHASMVEESLASLRTEIEKLEKGSKKQSK